MDGLEIASCGLNCGVCYMFLRDRKRCPGCRKGNDGKPKHCGTCAISTCPQLSRTNSGLCAECPELPCQHLRLFDRRYYKKYRISPVENLERVKQAGIDVFLAEEKNKWPCQICGQIRCMHTENCPGCGHNEQEINTNDK